jgi:hypothetical protein
VQTTTPPTGETAATRTPEELLTELDRLLTERGFTVTVDPKRWGVTVQNPAASDLKQVVRIGGNNGAPWWFWEWSGPGARRRPRVRAHAPGTLLTAPRCDHSPRPQRRGPRTPPDDGGLTTRVREPYDLSGGSRRPAVTRSGSMTQRAPATIPGRGSSDVPKRAVTT